MKVRGFGRELDLPRLGYARFFLFGVALQLIGAIVFTVYFVRSRRPRAAAT